MTEFMGMQKKQIPSMIDVLKEIKNIEVVDEQVGLTHL
jgi:hypothetical protein